MSWHEKIVAAHTSVTDSVSHGMRLKSDRYFVWQEDGRDDLTACNRHIEKRVTGTTDLFTMREFDPWAGQFEAALDVDPDIAWELNDVQFEQDTGFWHYEWIWSVSS